MAAVEVTFTMVAGAALPHAGQEGLDHPGRPEDVGLEHPSDLVERHGLDRALDTEPGVVDEHIDRARLGDHARDRLVGVDVEGELPATSRSSIVSGRRAVAITS